MTDIPAGKYELNSDVKETIWKGSSKKRYRVMGPTSGTVHVSIEGSGVDTIVPNESLDVEGTEITLQRLGNDNASGEYYNLD